MKKNQVFIGILVLILMVIFAVYQYSKSSNLALFLITGLALGYIFTRSRYGFAGGVRKIYFTGDGSLTKALLLMFALSMIATVGIHYGAAQKGAVTAFNAAEGDAIIPGTGFVQKASLSTIIGGILFGIGMIFGGGCASGTLTDTGEGEAKGWIVLLFFCIGGVFGTAMDSWWKESFFSQAGIRVYLPDVFGYVGTIIVSLLLLLLIYVITNKYEDKRKKEGTQNKEVYEDWQKPLPELKEYKFFSKETYHKMFVERWSFYTGAVLTALIFIFIINTTGTSWGVSGPYTLWGVWLFEKVGIDFGSMPAFKGIVDTVNNGLLNHPVTIRNIGMIFGSAIALLLAGNFKFNFDFKGKDALFYAIGGILMGYGAKVAGGCNAGALYSGLSNFSLSGWFFLVAMTVGGIIGSRIYENVFLKDKKEVIAEK
ncbi:YeeE/YedE family protein [Clostridium sp. Cult2]|uniref:YeeE/YedE family protein n=1 Tax=Clostridium sp. Cult2 TaxID=2079003 RepID=UPI001F42B4B3|nr:YeeE/YedE family protein [Clostridium sp. Cult2]MCF6464737.1 YeeE/YedE family protein [Clostridium sp. Cult2]